MKNHDLFVTRRLGKLFAGWMLLCLCGSSLVFWPDVHASDTPPKADPGFLFLPLVQAQAETPLIAQPTPAPCQWDARLDARSTLLTTTTPSAGQGYWRLVSARWYDEAEAGGRHHILVDLLDQEGRRMVNIPVRIYWSGGETIIHTQAKENEAYAADFGMFDVAPSYGAIPATGDPADDVWGMGLGSIEQPNFKIHSSYGLVWQWTIHAEAIAPTSTPTAMPPSPDETPTPTSTPTASPDAEPTREWDARLEARGIVLAPAAVAPGEGYWRLVRARWFDERESGGRHHTFVDLLDADGARRIGAPMRIYWNGGEATVHTEAKPGEEYAANFGMNSIAPAYGAHPADGQPADSVWGMGLGSIEQPYHAIQTSYGFVWQWTVKPTAPGDEPATTLTAAP